MLDESSGVKSENTTHIMIHPNRKYPTPAPDRTQLRDGSPRQRQAGAQKRPMRTRKPAPFAAQESPDDLSDSGGGIRKRTRTLG